MADLSEMASKLPQLPESDAEWKTNVQYEFAHLPIVLEYLQGDVRRKIGKDGAEWASTMPAAYGFIAGTTDRHGEAVDIYVAPIAEREALIYVVDQIEPQTHVFDEHKVMLGFSSEDEAHSTYCMAFSDGSGPARVGDIVTFTQDQFLAWIEAEGSIVVAASLTPLPHQSSTTYAALAKPRPNPAVLTTKTDETGGVIVDLPEIKEGTFVKVCAGEGGGLVYKFYIYTAILPRLCAADVNRLIRVLHQATPADRVEIHLSSPGGCVYTMGRITNAMARTKALVATYAEGPVASAAVSIWAAGHERHIQTNAFFMQHMSSQQLMGKTPDLAQRAAFCQGYIATVLSFQLGVGLFTDDEVTEMTKTSADIYITGAEMIERLGAVSTISKGV